MVVAPGGEDGTSKGLCRGNCWGFLRRERQVWRQWGKGKWPKVVWDGRLERLRATIGAKWLKCCLNHADVIDRRGRSIFGARPLRDQQGERSWRLDDGHEVRPF